MHQRINLSLYAVLAMSLLAPLAAGDSLGFFSVPYQAAESAGGFDILVTRSGSGAGAVGVDVAASGGGGAVLDTDFGAASPASLAWADGDTTPQIVHIPVLHNPAYSPTHSVTVTLSAPTGGAVLDSSGLALVHVPIREADANPAGTLGVSIPDPSAVVTVYDDCGSLTVTAVRSGGSTGAVSLTLGLSDSTAIAGTDYTVPGSTVLAWADGESGGKSFAVPILPHAQATGQLRFYINETAIAGGASLGNSGMIVSIIDHLPAVAGTVACTPWVGVRELAGPALVRVERIGGSTGAVDLDYAINPGSAQDGINLTAGSGTLHWADGDATAKTVAVPILADGTTTPTLYGSVTFANPTNGLILPQYTQCTLAILDDDGSAGVLGFSTDQVTVREDAGQAVAVVTRSGGAAGAITVDWASSDGSAVSGTHYTGGSGTLHWADGDSAPKTIVFPIVHDGQVAAAHAFYVDIANPGGGAAIDDGWSFRSELTVVITDVDFPVDTLAMAGATAQVHELDGAITLTAVRSGGGLLPVSVPLTIAGVSAVAGTDFGPASTTTLSWGAGDLAPKTVTIPILHDGLPGGARTFSVGLAPAANGALTAAPYATVVTILDDDPAPAGTVAFADPAPSASAAGGPLSLTLRRTGGSTGAISVDWYTVFAAPATARPGLDALPAAGTVAWADGDAADKTIAVTLLDDGLPDLGRTLLVRLANPVGGAVLDGSAGTVDAVITITDPTVHDAGDLAFADSAPSASRGSGTARIRVLRSGGSSGAVSVDYATYGGSALDGVEFTPAFGTLRWTDGDSAAKTIAVPLLRVAKGTADHDFWITLGNASGGALIATYQAEVTLTAPGAASSGSDSGCGAGVMGAMLALACLGLRLRRR